MSKTYYDQIPPETGRKYSITANPDGRSSIADVTQYIQDGTPWGADDANQTVGKEDFEAHTHTKSQISDFPASMPANGGNADYATNAAYATNAGNATSATNATNANYANSAGYANGAGNVNGLRFFTQAAAPTPQAAGDLWIW